MGKRLRILHVEDEAIFALEMKRELERSGYEAIPHVSTGEAAVACARKEHPDLVLMDIGLAGEIDGIDAAGAIMDESDAAIIFLTGYDNAEIRARAQLLHPLGFLVKPHSMKDIRVIIDRYSAEGG